MEDNLHPAVVRSIDHDVNERLIASLTRRGYWCPRCDRLAPPLTGEFNQKGKDGFCESCQRNPLDKDAA